MVAQLSLILAFFAILASGGACAEKGDRMQTQQTRDTADEVIALPAPDRSGSVSLEKTLAGRRSVREFSAEPLTQQQLGQLLWAAQGMTGPAGMRTAPSAGALYPLELYVALAHGFFHYDPRRHGLRRIVGLDLRPALSRAALEQESVLHAPAVFLIAAVFERTAAKYGPDRAPRYVYMEAGHAAQNLLLQAVALGLGGVPVGAFQDARLQKVASLPGQEQPLYLIPVGHPR